MMVHVSFIILNICQISEGSSDLCLRQLKQSPSNAKAKLRLPDVTRTSH